MDNNSGEIIHRHHGKIFTEYVPTNDEVDELNRFLDEMLEEQYRSLRNKELQKNNKKKFWKLQKQ